MFRRVAATRYVQPFREGGSLPALMEADDEGMYVVKFRGSGHGPRVLVAELLCGELARVVGLRVPELVLVDLDAAIGPAEPDSEIQFLLEGSVGTNAGLDFLPGAMTFEPQVGILPPADLAADVVWFDALVMNYDRTPRNPNLLVWHGGHWLIDHGSALYVHANWHQPERVAQDPFDQIAEHVLLPWASSITAAHERHAGRITRELVDAVLASVPDELFAQDPLGRPADEVRAAYATFLAERLAASQGWVARAEAARP